MDIQTRKLEFIKEFLKVHNEELINRLENLLYAEPISYDDTIEEVMSIQELKERVEKSLSDSKNNRLTSNEDLLSEIEQWK
ncbi:hypothetical protein [Myroides phaeus]|uniref:Addiction module component n=1 Tax=Myroides phaeus TaxID=702745 RepID=A0A1G8ET48_9FLAO|nr:hypothetical protein [Myroides phaeus]MEC4116640.1 hypothetical protein [Myroides phaeus]SDH73063.1 hypothetical protein SAMN05421818_11264 [Myroides phaeus]